MGCFKGGEGKLASGPVYHPSYLSPQQPPRGRARECTDEQKLVRCEREWGGGGPRQKGKKKGMKRMTGDKQGLAREKSRGRVDNEERERWQEGDR